MGVIGELIDEWKKQGGELLTVEELKEILEIAQQEEKQANAERIMVEKLILDHNDIRPELPEKGSKTIGPFEITIGETEKWDQAFLSTQAGEIKDEFFPFKVEYKKDAKKAKAIAELHPDLWEMLKQGLTTKPAKPAVKIKEVKK